MLQNFIEIRNNILTFFLKKYFISQDQMRYQVHLLNFIQIRKLIFLLKKLILKKEIKFILFLSLSNEIFKRILYIQLKKNQLFAALGAANNFLIEMNTGEGKTFVILLTILWHGINKRIIHFMSVNNYLLSRDYNVAKNIYIFYNFTNFIINSDTNALNLQSQIFYGTPQNFGFLFLKNSFNPFQLKHFIFDILILDEMDYILYEILNTPLILSNSFQMKLYNYLDLYFFFNTQKLLPLRKVTSSFSQIYYNTFFFFFFKENKNYLPIIDFVTIKWFYIYYLYNYSIKNVTKGIDYIISNKNILILDTLTGRILKNHTFSNGIQESIEIKENLSPSTKSNSSMTLDLFYYFYLYKKIFGFSGTLGEEASLDLFKHNFHIYAIRTQYKSLRLDHSVLVLSTFYYKDNIQDLFFFINQKKQPKILFFENLKMINYFYNFIRKNILIQFNNYSFINAFSIKNESELIPKIGLFNTLSISTNITSRGTDIPIGFHDLKSYYLEISIINMLGGLFLYFYDIPKSERIFKQLQGRTGRQKNDGESKTIISLNNKFLKNNLNQIIKIFYSKILIHFNSTQMSIIDNTQYYINILKNINTLKLTGFKQNKDLPFTFDSLYNKLYFNQIWYNYLLASITQKYKCYYYIEFYTLKKQLLRYFFLKQPYIITIKTINYLFNTHVFFTTIVLKKQINLINIIFENYILILFYKNYIFKETFKYVYAVSYNMYLINYLIFINQINQLSFFNKIPLITLNKDIYQRRYLQSLLVLLTIESFYQKLLYNTIIKYNKIIKKFK